VSKQQSEPEPPSDSTLLLAIERALREAADSGKSIGMAAYMRNLFPFLGIATPLRRRTVRAQLQQFGCHNAQAVATSLWMLSDREFQYAACDVLSAKSVLRNLMPSDIQWLEDLVILKSWWDTVDCLAPNIVGNILFASRSELVPIVNTWIESENIWLQRSAIIVQLGWKHDTNHRLLFHSILRRASSTEFFVQKGAGWALREYSKTEPLRVRLFIDAHPELSALTRREGGKYC